MSQQGGRPTGHDDDWWRHLYDDSTDDTGPTPAPDSLDDRFASAAGAVGNPADERPASEPAVPAPRAAADQATDPPRAPWEPPASRPEGPLTFPTATKPPERAGRAPDRPPTGGTTSPTGPRGPAEAPTEPPATTPPISRTSQLPPPPPPPLPTTPPSWPSPEFRPAERPPAPPRSADAPSATPRPADPAIAPPRPADPAIAPPRPAGPPPPPHTPADQPTPRIERPAPSPRPRGYVGSRPPTYDAEPIALPAADPDDLDDLVADTVLDGARYGACTLRAVSVRGDSARYRGEPRRDSLLTARFGTGEHALLLVAMATGARAAPGAHRAAAEACHWIGRAVGRSHARLVADIRDGRRGDLKSGLHRLTDRSLGKLRASASEQGVDPEEYAAGLRCLLLSADPECRTRVFFGVGPGGLFRLRDGEWQDIEPQVAEIKGEPVLGFGSPPSETPEGDRFTMDLGIPTPPSPYEPAPEPPREPFRFRTSVARPGDTLLLCSGGLAEPLRGEPELGDYLAERWSRPDPPGLAAFLADSQVRVKGYADDRTAAAVWEA
ncbi:protein phosphatase 2C domain-containing protein [Streptomyces sp. NPDC050546]|uniref:protein phosphatase 2C domain-containing protein n=1 Tax=Streptomyces sp. NPDC050546 TaxID=3365628 RepID=UPI003795ADD9